MRNKLNIELNKAIATCRIARKLGNISEKTQQRILRRVRTEDNGWDLLIALREERQTRLNRFRKSIAAEVAPVARKKQEIEYDLFLIEYRTSTELKDQRTLKPMGKRVTAPISAELNVGWWEREEKAEREAKKAIRRKLKAGIEVSEVELVKYGFLNLDTGKVEIEAEAVAA